jgi:hypothetical protein
MAVNSDIGGNGTLFVGEDKTFKLELLDSTYDPLVPGSGIPVDMTGWALLFDIRQKDTSPEPAIVSKTPTLIGVYNVVRSVNTQRATTTLTDTEMNLFKAKAYRQSWKRMDDGVETVLAWGDFAPQKATAP